PADYRWSSYRATAGLEEAPEWLAAGVALLPFGPDAATASNEYQKFVCAKIGSKERLWDKVVHAIYLGSPEWAKRMRKQVESKLRSSDHPRKQRGVGRPRMHEVVAAVAKAGSTSVATIRKSRGGMLRALAAWLGWNEGWLTLRSIAAS